MNPILAWFRRYFSDPQVTILTVFLAFGAAVVLFMGDMLMPLIASLVIAYLLEALVQRLERLGLPRLPAVLLVFTFFSAVLLFALLGLAPLLVRQATQLLQQLPVILARGQEALMRLPEAYPEFITQDQVVEIIADLRGQLAQTGQRLLSLSVSSAVGLVTVVVYLVLVPMLVLFFLKDKGLLLGWLRRFFPDEMGLTRKVWRDVDRQIGNYVRGKLVEIVIVGTVTYTTFSLLGLQFALLLAVVVGLSVIIPYIGAAVVTIPVALVAYYQWGWGTDFLTVLVAYGIIQALDGNVLVPLLFSEVVNLHPVAIITAILVFGGLWGFWGVFFAIPLATLVRAVIEAWPRSVDLGSGADSHGSG